MYSIPVLLPQEELNWLNSGAERCIFSGFLGPIFFLWGIQICGHEGYTHRLTQFCSAAPSSPTGSPCEEGSLGAVQPAFYVHEEKAKSHRDTQNLTCSH